VHDGGVSLLPTFGFVSIHEAPLRDGIAQEAEWMHSCAASGRAVAHLWRGTPGMIVSRRYTLMPGWSALAAAQAASVQVRPSGGGLVPQGPGIWNLSLAWPVASSTPQDTSGVYRSLCDALADAFARLGVVATPQAVTGSFCDGRYNLASRGRKFVGTAQAWRRVGAQPVVLVHAVIVVDADPLELTERTNAFEAALGSPTRYRADALTSIAIEAGDAGIEPQVLKVIGEQFARVVPPRFAQEMSHGSA
jgi:lipoate-protein ligase A